MRHRASRRPCTWSHSPPARVAARARLPGRRTAPPTTCREVLEHRPIGLEGIDDVLVERHDAARHPRATTCRCCPDGQRLAARRVRRRDEGRGRREGARADGRELESARTACRRDEALRRPERGAARLGGARGRPRRDARSSPARTTRGRAGRTRRCRPSGSATTCATSRKLARQLRLRERALRPLRPGLRPRRSNFDLEHSRGHREVPRASSTRRPTSSSRYGGSLSGEHGDGQSRAELLPKMFGAGAGRGVPRVQGDLGPRLAR